MVSDLNLKTFFNAGVKFTHQGLMFKDHKMRKAIKLLQVQTCTCSQMRTMYLQIFIGKGLQHTIQQLVKPDHYEIKSMFYLNKLKSGNLILSLPQLLQGTRIG